MNPHKDFKMKLRTFLVIIFGMFQPSVCADDNLQVEGLHLTVKIYQDIPKHLCGRALDNLEAVLTSSSSLLSHSTSRPITSISIILPPTLVKTACTANITLHTFHHEPVDILLTDRDPVFGSSPFSVQHGGCGERGRHVILPLDSLVQGETVTDDTSEFNAENDQVPYISISVDHLSSSLVSHLYGVFPTHGYSTDSRYPLSYQVGEVVLDNAGCSLKNKVGHKNSCQNLITYLSNVPAVLHSSIV